MDDEWVREETERQLRQQLRQIQEEGSGSAEERLTLGMSAAFFAVILAVLSSSERSRAAIAAATAASFGLPIAAAMWFVAHQDAGYRTQAVCRELAKRAGDRPNYMLPPERDLTTRCRHAQKIIVWLAFVALLASALFSSWSISGGAARASVAGYLVGYCYGAVVADDPFWRSLSFKR